MKTLLLIGGITLFFVQAYGQGTDAPAYRHSNISKEERQKEAKQFRSEKQGEGIERTASNRTNMNATNMNVPQKVATRPGVKPHPAVRQSNVADMNKPQAARTKKNNEAEHPAIRDKKAFDYSKPQLAVKR